MSGGRRIDDHSVWVGKGSKGSVFPDGPHKVKMESSAEGVGELMDYEDTTEKIHASQVMAKKKVQSHPRKSLHRN